MLIEETLHTGAAKKGAMGPTYSVRVCSEAGKGSLVRASTQKIGIISDGVEQCKPWKGRDKAGADQSQDHHQELLRESLVEKGKTILKEGRWKKSKLQGK